jgi:hypothetical protein
MSDNYAPNRVYVQYRNDPPTVAWFNIIPTVAGEIYNVYEQIRESYDIDKASGELLNIIGRIVDIDRSYETKIVFEVNQWGSQASQFGGNGIQYKTTGKNINNEVSDVIYRMLIKSKIAKNNSNATLDDIVTSLKYIVGVDKVRVIDNRDMSFSVSFGEELNDTSRFVIDNFDIIPRPQGVRFSGYTEEPSITQYGGKYGWGSNISQYGQFFGD